MVYDEGASSDLEEQPRQKDAQEDASHKALKDKALKDKVLKEKASDKTEELVDRQLPFVGLKAALQELGSLQAQKGEDEA